MGLFGKKKKDVKPENTENMEMGKGGGFVQPASKSSEELQDLLNEFREMRAGVNSTNNEVHDETHDVEELSETGEEYHVSEDESQSIENFLSGTEEEEFEEEPVEEDDEEILEDELVEEDEIEDEEEVIDGELDEELIGEDEVEEEDLGTDEEFIDEEELDFDEESVEEEIEEEAIDEDIVEDEEADEEEFVEDEETDGEEVVEDEAVEEESVSDEGARSAVDVDVTINEVPKIQEDESDYEYYIDEDDVDETKEAEEEDYDLRISADAVTNEELDKKFDEFENRLLEKLLAQFQMMQPANSSLNEQKVEAKTPVKASSADGDDELVISTDNGKLVINGFKFSGEVIMFTPIESVKKASWEEVVRRKGHCTYHLTTSGNGGWFIKKSNAPNPYAYIEKKEEAEELAMIYAKREKAELKIHNAKGVIEKSLSFGREKLRG